MRKNWFCTAAVCAVMAIAFSACRLGADIYTLREKAWEAEAGDELPDAPIAVPSPRPEPVNVEMVYVSGGSFRMGKELGSAGLGDVTPVRTVTLTGFYMGKYPITQAQYQAVMGRNPSNFSSNPAGGEVQGNRPAENVSWYDAVEFCNRLSAEKGLSPAYRISGSGAESISGSNGYRLPTEAQWEYAAKGGNGSPENFTYAGSDTVEDVAWYEDNSNYRSHEVGKKQPNGLGLHDMSGNVWEWCWDWFGTYPSGTQANPMGPSAGEYRVLRGGSWLTSAEYARSAGRYGSYPDDRNHYVGFRLARPQ